MAFTRPQAAVGATFGAAPGARTLAYTSNVTAGNLLVVAVATEVGTGTTVTVSDTRGNSWQQAGTYAPTSIGTASIWYATANGSGANTVSVLPSTSSYMSIGAIERAGNAASSVLRAVSTAASGTGTSASTNSVAALAGDFVIAIATQGTGNIAVTVASPFTLQVNQPDGSSSVALYAADDLSASGTEAATFTFGSSAGWATLAAAFKPSAGDTTPPVVASASVNAAGTTLTISFTEASSPPVLPASSVTGFTLKAGGISTGTLTATAISSLTYTATPARTILQGETLTLDYAPGNVTDSAATPNAMATFSGTPVTNNSTQIGAATSYTLSGPSSGAANFASSNFSVTPKNGSLAGTYTGTITPHTSGAGTFSPASLTFSGTSAAQTFTYTPSTTAGSPHAITTTASPALGTDPSAINYTVAAAAHAYTSQRAGDWNVPSGTPSSPWYDVGTGGTQAGWNSIPSSADNDTVTIVHAVTATSDISIGDGTASTVLTCAGGSLTVTGCALTIRGNASFGVSISGTMIERLKLASTGGASASLLLDGNSGVTPIVTCATDTLLTFTGNLAHHVTVRTKSGTAGSPGYFTNNFVARSIYVNWSYTDFSFLGGSAQAGFIASHVDDEVTAPTPLWLMDHCTVDNCGLLPSLGLAGPTVNCQITNCKWTNLIDATGRPYTISMSGALNTGTRLMRNCVTPDGVGQATFNLVTDVTFDNCYFGSMILSGNTQPPWAVMQNCFLYQSTNYGADTTDTNGNITDCFCLIGTASGGASFGLSSCNVAGSTWSGNVFQAAWTSDRAFYLVGTGEEGSEVHRITFTHNLVLPNFGGNSSGYLAANFNDPGGVSVLCNLEHNTQFIGPTDGTNAALALMTAGVSERADIIDGFKSNLIVRTGAATGTGCYGVANAGNGPVLDAIAASNTDYNAYTALDTVAAGHWAAVAGSGGEVGTVYNSPMSGVPGTHDVHLGSTSNLATGGPKFVDPTRGLLAFDSHMGGPGTLAHALAALKAQFDSTDVNYVAGYTTAALVAWTKAGWAPRNAALRGTAHDSGDIGAIAWQSGAATSYTLTPPISSAGRPGVASGNFTVQLDGIPTSAVTITPNDSGGGGTFTPSTLLISDASTHTFTHTAATVGPKIIGCTNDRGLTDPANVSYRAYAITITPSAQSVAVNTAASLTANLTGGTPPPLAATTTGGTLSTATPMSGTPFTLTTQASGSGVDVVTVTGPGGSTATALIFYPITSSIVPILLIGDDPMRLGTYYRVVGRNDCPFDIPANKVTSILDPWTSPAGTRAPGTAVNVVASGDGSGFASVWPQKTWRLGVTLNNSVVGNLGGLLLTSVDVSSLTLDPSKQGKISFHLQASPDGSKWPDVGTSTPIDEFTVYAGQAIVTHSVAL